MLLNNREILASVEQIVLQLLKSLIIDREGLIKVPGNNVPMTLVRKVSYKRSRSRHRFCLVVQMLCQVHILQLDGGSCTLRGLYYRDPELIRSQRHIVAANLDVCRILRMAPAHLGILTASKGLMAGDIQMFMSNGDVLDCNVYCGAMSLPPDFEKVDRIATQAEFVLVVEKESVFESLLSRHLFNSIASRFILLTGKGYPDCSTRRIVHRLNIECRLPAYILVDADPFGIEIMLVYRHGSQSMSFSSNCLATPKLRWIGLHPSEICNLSDCLVALSAHDNKKINDILQRPNIGLGVRQELCTLQRLQSKAEIESVLDLLSADYIPNKISRNLFL